MIVVVQRLSHDIQLGSWGSIGGKVGVPPLGCSNHVHRDRCFNVPEVLGWGGCWWVGGGELLYFPFSLGNETIIWGFHLHCPSPRIANVNACHGYALLYYTSVQTLIASSVGRLPDHCPAGDQTDALHILLPALYFTISVLCHH